MSICNACGSLGNPGIRRISPAIATIISAPLLITISLIWNSKLFTAPINLRIGRKRVLCLGNTNRIMSDSHFLNQLDAVAGDAAVRNDAGSIKVGSHFLNLLLYAVFFFIRITQRFGRIISIVSTTRRAISTAPSPPSLNALLMA